MAENQQPDSPTQQLGKLIRDKLVASGLISHEKADEFERKLVGGQLRQDDWKLLLERVSQPKEEGKR